MIKPRSYSTKVVLNEVLNIMSLLNYPPLKIKQKIKFRNQEFVIVWEYQQLVIAYTLRGEEHCLKNLKSYLEFKPPLKNIDKSRITDKIVELIRNPKPNKFNNFWKILRKDVLKQKLNQISIP